MYSILRKFLFFFDPERVHYFTMNSLSLFLKIGFIKKIFRNKFIIQDKTLVTNVFGLDFRNPVGLAAGLIKTRNILMNCRIVVLDLLR